MLAEDELEFSILAKIGNCIAWIFIPLGWAFTGNANVI